MDEQPDKTVPLAAAEPDPTDTPHTSSGVTRGQLLGRYVLLRRLGAGGAGEVFAAFDPVLDRTVALKVLHSELHAGTSLVQEGRLLAKLVHPAVVAVHDFGIDDGRAFMAMELVDGEPFKAWSRARFAEGDWRSMLAAMLEVGEALAAAHKAGLVHGDVKPTNILRDQDGRTKVVDFGIARLAGGGSDASPKACLAGTPAYMAPEQYRGLPAHASSDQYAFCLTAWVMFHDRHPWLGELGEHGDDTSYARSEDNANPLALTTLGSQADRWAEAHGRWTPGWASPLNLPSTISDALLRGLNADPGQRWPDMQSLVAELRRRSLPRRRAVPIVVALALVATGLLGSWALTDDALPCAHAADPIREIWQDERRASVREAMTADTTTYAASADLVERSLDRFASQWVARSQRACSDTHIRKVQSDRALDLRTACLKRALAEVDATIGVLTSGGPDIRSEAHRLVSRLPDLTRCDDSETLRDRSLTQGTPKQAALETRLRPQLARVRALRIGGDSFSAATELKQLRPRSQQLSDTRFAVELGLERLHVLASQGKFQEAVAQGQQVLELAWKFEALELAMETNSALALIVGYELGQTDVGLIYAQTALGLARRAGVNDATVAEALRALAAVHLADANYATAAQMQRQALAILIDSAGPESIASAEMHNDLAVTLAYQAQTFAAREQYTRAKEIREAVLGPTHPLVADSLLGLGTLDSDTGNARQAARQQRQALALVRDVFGPDHYKVAVVEAALGNTLAKTSKIEESLGLLRHATEVLTSTLGPHNIRTVLARGALAVVLADTGDLDGALAQAQEGLAIAKTTLGPTHPHIAGLYASLAVIRVARGELEAEGEALRAALAIYQQNHGPRHAETLGTLLDLISNRMRQGNSEAARVLMLQAEDVFRTEGEQLPFLRATLDYDRAMLAQRDKEFALAEAFARKAHAARTQHDAPKHIQANAAFLLARILWAQGKHTQSRDFADKAQQTYGATPPAGFDIWYAEHR